MQFAVGGTALQEQIHYSHISSAYECINSILLHAFSSNIKDRRIRSS